MRREIRRNTFPFVTKDEAHRPDRRPCEQVHRGRRSFNGHDPVSVRRQRAQRGSRVGLVFPGDIVFGAERRLGDGTPLSTTLIGVRRDAAEHDALDACGISRSKDRTGVVEAPDVVEQDNDVFADGHRRAISSETKYAMIPATIMMRPMLRPLVGPIASRPLRTSAAIISPSGGSPIRTAPTNPPGTR